MGNCLLRLPAVQQKCSMSRSSLLAMVKDGCFPKPIKLGDRAVAWVESEVDAWIDQRIAERDAEGGA